MRFSVLLIVLTVTVSTASYADSSATAKRDAAFKEINACLRRNEASSRECKSMNKNIGTLEELYRQGDQTVLPTLLQFTYLTQTDFFGDSLIANPNTFLTAVSRLSGPDQQRVATCIAGAMFGLARPRFDAIQATLMNIPKSSPIYQLAQECLAKLQTDNALFIINYFPPQTFAEGPRNFLVRSYSGELYALGEKPLPDLAKDVNAEIYRLMVLPTWGNAVAVRIDRHGELFSLSARRLDGQAGYEPGKLIETKDSDLSVADSKALEALIQNLNFFELPTKENFRGFDGDEWILEGVSQGNYHVVERWCATSYNPQKRGLTAFVALCKFLVDKSALSESPQNKGHKLI